jgi:hypothetical protein
MKPVKKERATKATCLQQQIEKEDWPQNAQNSQRTFNRGSSYVTFVPFVANLG